ncbi:hypothetical protein scyTo_0021772, partial [Scyliorhinus torazame]|nr:hypothetical protein [Scyliorhinus torazame]
AGRRIPGKFLEMDGVGNAVQKKTADLEHMAEVLITGEQLSKEQQTRNGRRDLGRKQKREKNSFR